MFKDWLNSTIENEILQESAGTARYSIGVNFRTKKNEVLESYAKITLGYVSASLKQHGYHTKHIYEEKPLRLLVSSRNWDDGEWVVAATWNHEKECFVVSQGYWNRIRRTVSIDKSFKCEDSAEKLSKHVFNLLQHLKDKPDRHQEKLKGVPLKRGPKS